MPHSTTPPCGEIVRIRSERVGLIDPASDDLPERNTGRRRYSNLLAAGERLGEALRSGTDPLTLSRDDAGLLQIALTEYEGRVAALERRLVGLEHAIERARTEYVAAPGDRATGAKERALRRLFGEPEGGRGRRYDVQHVARDYLALREGEGDVRLELGRHFDGVSRWVWCVPGCPKKRDEALACVKWAHQLPSVEAVAQTLRRHRALHPLLERDFPRR